MSCLADSRMLAKFKVIEIEIPPCAEDGNDWDKFNHVGMNDGNRYGLRDGMIEVDCYSILLGMIKCNGQPTWDERLNAGDRIQQGNWDIELKNSMILAWFMVFYNFELIIFGYLSKSIRLQVFLT